MHSTSIAPFEWNGERTNSRRKAADDDAQISKKCDADRLSNNDNDDNSAIASRTTITATTATTTIWSLNACTHQQWENQAWYYHKRSWVETKFFVEELPSALEQTPPLIVVHRSDRRRPSRRSNYLWLRVDKRTNTQGVRSNSSLWTTELSIPPHYLI